MLCRFWRRWELEMPLVRDEGREYSSRDGVLVCVRGVLCSCVWVCIREEKVEEDAAEARLLGRTKGGACGLSNVDDERGGFLA